MSDWSRLFESCKCATGAEITDTFDASEVIDQLASSVDKLTSEISKMYTKEQLVELCRLAFTEGELTEAMVSTYDSFGDWCLDNI